MFTRITILAVITLFSVFALTTSTHAATASAWDWGSDSSYPANGYAYVKLYGTAGQAMTSHTVWCYNYSFNDDLTCFYSFEAQILEKPVIRAQTQGSFKARHKDRNGRTQAVRRDGVLSLGLGQLEAGQYTLDAYTRLNADGIQIKAETSVKFWHN